MGREQSQANDAGQFEWVNVWAAAPSTNPDAVVAEQAEQPLAREPEPAVAAAPSVAPQQTPVAAAPTAAGRFVAVKPVASKATPKPASKPAPQIIVPLPAANAAVAAILPDQLMRDIAEIERARDALAAGPFSVQRLRTFMVVPGRTSDSVPLVIGGVLALVMLTVFGAAAAVSKFGR